MNEDDFVWEDPIELVPKASAGTRDRYIAARFPGLATCASDLDTPALVIEGARHYFDEGKVDRALELLDLAVARNPQAEPFALARLEIAFLLRDATLFIVCALEFQRFHAASAQWEEICRLGRAVAPGEPAFGARQGDHAHEHHGPWPNVPNWLHASWDASPSALAASYHRAMASEAARSIPLTLISVAA